MSCKHKTFNFKSVVEFNWSQGRSGVMKKLNRQRMEEDQSCQSQTALLKFGTSIELVGQFRNY